MKMIHAGELHVAADTSRTIMDYIRCIDVTEDEDYSICPNCEEAMLQEQLHQDIATASDMPIEIVKRVLAGQDEVLGMDE